MFKKWNKTSKEEKAAILCALGLSFGLIFVVLSTIFNSTVLTCLACLAGFVWSYGCLKMCIVYAHLPEWQARIGIFGCFGLFGLLVLELAIGWIALEFFNTELPTVTAWYAIPCFICVFTSLTSLLIKNRKERKELKKLFGEGQR